MRGRRGSASTISSTRRVSATGRSRGRGRRRSRSFAAGSCEIGVESVTVSSPYLLRLVKVRFPSLKVRISVFGGVDRLRKAQMWEEMGADCIVLDSILVNREFATLSRIREVGEVRPRAAGQQQLPFLLRPLPVPHERPRPRRPVVARQRGLLHRLVLPAVHGDEAARPGELHPLGVDPAGGPVDVRGDGVRPVQGGGARPSHAGDGEPGAGLRLPPVRRQSPRPGPAVRLPGDERRTSRTTGRGPGGSSGTCFDRCW